MANLDDEYDKFTVVNFDDDPIIADAQAVAGLSHELFDVHFRAYADTLERGVNACLKLMLEFSELLFCDR